MIKAPIWLILLFPLFLRSQEIKILGEQTVASDLRIEKYKYGGISALAFANGEIWGISDDRGQFGPPRIFKHNLKNLEVKPTAIIKVEEPNDYSVVDYEGLVRLQDGRFIISSEGDFNKKPRVFPFVKQWNEKSKWQKGLDFPDGFLPEKVGMQTKGLINNSCFEGMTISPDEKNLFLMSEVSLFQNQNNEIEFLQYEIQDNQWKLKARKAYLRDTAPEGSAEVMRGVSEILYWKENHLLVLERWVRLKKTKPVSMGAELFSVQITDMKKKKLYSFDGELAENWEGMAWGPDLSDGRRQLILVSDNNFERLTPTKFLFLSFKP